MMRIQGSPSRNRIEPCGTPPLTGTMIHGDAVGDHAVLDGETGSGAGPGAKSPTPRDSHRAMVFKVLSVISLVTLPLSVALWNKSHKRPEHYRCDLTPYKSLRVFLKNGTCGLELLDMPTGNPVSGEFRGVLAYDPNLLQRSFLLTSKPIGPYRFTWLVFPFWLSTGALMLFAVIPVARGPLRRWWRIRHGRCVECGYDLRGTRSRRCPECGTRFR